MINNPKKGKVFDNLTANELLKLASHSLRLLLPCEVSRQSQLAEAWLTQQRFPQKRSEKKIGIYAVVFVPGLYLGM